MQKIDKMSFGLFVTLSGTITVDELQQALRECQQLWPTELGPRSTIVDLRALIIPQPDAIDFLTSTFYPTRREGLMKIAVIYDSPVIKARTRQMSFETGTTDIVRFIDASKVPDWHQQSLDWFEGGAPPTDSPTDPPHKVSPST